MAGQPAAAVVGVLDSRGNHIDPQVAVSASGGAIVATRIAEAGEPARALSISTRPRARARWSAPLRLRATGAVRHLVAAGRSGERIVAWQSPGQIWVGRPRRSGKGWERFVLDSSPTVRELLAVAVGVGGSSQVVWRTEAGVESAHAAVDATRFSRLPTLPLAPAAEIVDAGVSLAGQKAIVSWREPDRQTVRAGIRTAPGSEWESGAIGRQAGAAPAAAINASGVAGVVWPGPAAVPQLARRLPGGAWSVRAAAGAATGSPDVQINRRGALLSQWVAQAPGQVGGAYHPANRDHWIPTEAARGRGFLRERRVDWIDPSLERARPGLPDGSETPNLQVVHVDERGDVFATLTGAGGGSIALFQRPQRETSRWSVRALSAIGVEGPRIAANARGDIVAAFLTPSEFVPGTLNSGIATTSPALTVRGARRVGRASRFVLRVGLPDQGRLTVRVGTVVARTFGVARRRQSVPVRAPRRTGTYRVQFILRTADGRSYTGAHTIRVN